MKILSLNLCATWTRPRKERLGLVADFVKANEIDVLLVQEGIRSCFVYDTIRQLAGMLGYDYFAKSTFGWPLFWEFRVGVISRFPIIRTASLNCEIPQAEFLDSIPLPWRRRAVAATVNVPDLGITTLISVHLSSSPKTEAHRASQFLKLHLWINKMPPADVWICGGDFNAAQNDPAFLPVSGTGNVIGQAPDYIFVDGAKIAKDYPALSGHIVTDHDYGIVAEVEKV
jgi:endonuclease/exonuclease/phosphatase family metal-dependent hydrolase